MNQKVALALPMVLIGALLTVVLSLTMLAGLTDSAAAACPGAPGVSATVADGDQRDVEGWDAEQVTNAAAVISAGAEIGISLRGQTIGVMTAIGESSLRVLDYGDAVGPDSRGLFQQRDNGAWGTYADRMNPRISSLNFYKALMAVPGWEALPPTTAAHQTQRNADPYYYEQYFDDAVSLVESISAGQPGGGTSGAAAEAPGPGELDYDVLQAGGSGSCDQLLVTGSGTVVLPIPPSWATSDSVNWGASGGNWSSWHTGTDFSVPCGTPVIASTSGTVQIDTTESWSGQWLVKVSTGPGMLSTWYAHMQALSVTEGQVVAAGQVLGEVGSEGNSSGCHLHFEVHTAGGSIYGPDNVNPTDWLAANVGRQISGPVTPPAAGSGQVKVMTYNIARGAEGGQFLDAIAGEIAASGASIVGLNEIDDRGPPDDGADQATYLARKLGMYVSFAPNTELGGGVRRGNAVLSKYPISAATNVALPGAPGVEERGVLSVFANVEDTVVKVAVSHLHFTGDIRLTQAKAVAATLGAPSCATVLMGDMNSIPNSPVHTALTTAMRDTFTGGRFGEGLTSPAAGPRNRIDYIFHSAQTAPLSAQVLPRGASDHRGVVAVFALDPATSCG